MLQGHAWTIRRHVFDSFAGGILPPSALFRTRVSDQRFGQVELSGRLSEVGGQALLILVHGLGGSSQSSYLIAAARLAHDLGIDTLRLNLRGADRSGQDLFHAGISQDIDAVLQSDAVSRYRQRYLLGYSLGGHVCLKYAADYPTPAVDAIVAIGAPLHLDASAAAFDAQPFWPYRRHVLLGLLQMVGPFIARRGPWPIELSEARRIRRIRDFDARIVAPRFGFKDVSDYYFRASVAHHLHKIDVPTLLIHAREDPMVRRESVQPFLSALGGKVDAIELAQGGHVAFPTHASLGLPGPLGVEAQALTWLLRGRTR